MERSKKIAVAVIIAVAVLTIVFLASYFLYSSSKNTLPISEKSVPEIVSGNVPPSLVLPPPKVLSGTTIGIVKEVKVATGEIIADVFLPRFIKKGEAPPSDPAPSREFILIIGANSSVKEGLVNSKDIGLSDVKSGSKIQFKYSGDIMNPEMKSLNVVSLIVY